MLVDINRQANSSTEPVDIRLDTVLDGGPIPAWILFTKTQTPGYPNPGVYALGFLFCQEFKLVCTT